MPAVYLTAAAAALMACGLWGNRALSVSEYSVVSKKLPRSFDGFRIVQISDLHNGVFGKNNTRLLEKIRDCQPDILVITGDMIYGQTGDIQTAAFFAREAGKVAPVYFVPGNHEARMTAYPAFRERLLDAEVTLLENKGITLNRGKDSVELVGIVDPCFLSESYPAVNTAAIRELLQGLVSEGDGFRILLSHRPELFELYEEVGIDLAFTGHAHGGQIRIPGLGGLYAPGQGLFPKYTSGIHRKENCAMAVSRGLGRSLFPLRIFNRPEVVCVELKNME